MGVRSADPELDAAACAAIYAPHVDPGPASFEAAPPDAAEMARRIAGTVAPYDWLVTHRDGVVAGYAYSGPHRAREAYRWSAEVSVYVDGRFHRRGVGRELYAGLLERLRAAGVRNALAGITLPNDASVGLHEGLGFALVGVYRNVGFKAGAWRDVGWWQLDLRPDAPTPSS